MSGRRHIVDSDDDDDREDDAPEMAEEGVKIYHQRALLPFQMTKMMTFNMPLMMREGMKKINHIAYVLVLSPHL